MSSLFSYCRSFLSLLLVVLLLSVSVLIPKAQAANDPYSIAVIVGDTPITFLDIQQRLRLAMLNAGIPATPQNERQLTPQIIQLLIDETLYISYANELGITLSESMVDDTYNQVETQNQLPEGQFAKILEQQGSSKDAFKAQIRSQLARNEIIARKIRPLIRIQDEEVSAEYSHDLLYGGKEDVHISEISLPIEDESQAPSMMQLAVDLIKKIESGTSFDSVARQFSRSASAENGGEIGWVDVSKLSPDIREALKAISPGSISKPVLVGNNIMILKLHERTYHPAVPQATLEKINLTLQQLFVPIASITSVQETKAQMQKVRSRIKQCQDIPKLTSEVTHAQPTEAITATVDTFHKELRPLLIRLDTNKPSDIIKTSLGLHLFFVCDRVLPQEVMDSLPSEQDVKDQIFNRKMLLETRKLLRDLRRKTFIEVRM